MANAVIRSFVPCPFNPLQMVHLHETFSFFRWGGGGRKWNQVPRVMVSGRSALAVGMCGHLQLPALYTHVHQCLPGICPRARGSPVKLYLGSFPSWVDRAPSAYCTLRDPSQLLSPCFLRHKNLLRRWDQTHWVQTPPLLCAANRVTTGQLPLTFLKLNFLLFHTGMIPPHGVVVRATTTAKHLVPGRESIMVSLFFLPHLHPGTLWVQQREGDYSWN